MKLPILDISSGSVKFNTSWISPSSDPTPSTHCASSQHFPGSFSMIFLKFKNDLTSFDFPYHRLLFITCTSFKKTYVAPTHPPLMQLLRFLSTFSRSNGFGIPFTMTSSAALNGLLAGSVKVSLMSWVAKRRRWKRSNVQNARKKKTTPFSTRPYLKPGVC